MKDPGALASGAYGRVAITGPSMKAPVPGIVEKSAIAVSFQVRSLISVLAGTVSRVAVPL